MATDFTNNNTTISASGALRPKTTNTPLDIRTRVNSKADIESIPNPFVGMHIIVLQDETNDNQMTEYVVTSLKANNLGVADSKVNQVVLVKDFLGVSSASGSGMTSEQVQQLNTAYTHSQTPHVQQSDIPTKTSQLQNDSNFISSIPEEYVTEQELNSKGLATETFVTNKIAEAQVGGGEGSTVDLSGLGADLSLNGQTLKLKNSNGVEIGTGVILPQTSSSEIDAYTKQETDNIIQDYTGGKKQVYLTQLEYDALTDTEKNDATKVYNITDAVEQVIPADLTINDSNLLQLKDSNGNAIGIGVTVSTASEYTLPTASNTVLGGIKVGDRLSIDSNGVLSADVQQSTASNEVILTSPSGYRFKLIVNDEGVLSTEEIVTLGNIIASVNELSINEGESATFTISLSETPTRAQTISIVSDNTDVTVNPSSIAISDTNPHTITVSAAEDEGDYADETAVLTLSSPKVSNVTINVAIKDNDIEPKPCTGITLDQTSLSLTRGNVQQLVATVTPEGCTDEIVWSASNGNCTVENGLVTAVIEGDCIITATCGQYSATCTITVSTTSSIEYPQYGIVYTINSSSDGSATNITASSSTFDVFDKDNNLIEAVSTASKTYTFPENNKTYKIRLPLDDNKVINYILVENPNITNIEYLSIPPKATGLVRIVYGLNSLTNIGILDVNGNTKMPEISNCSKLTSISEFRNIGNVIRMNQAFAYDREMNFKLNPAEWWDRETLFVNYSGVFSNTKMVLSNPELPKSWGGNKSIPLTGITFKSDVPISNPAQYTSYSDYIDVMTPRYADTATWSISSPSNLCKIDNQSSIRFVYNQTEWDGFTGTEECILTATHNSNTIVTLTITLTK